MKGGRHSPVTSTKGQCAKGRGEGNPIQLRKTLEGGIKRKKTGPKDLRTTGNEGENETMRPGMNI